MAAILDSGHEVRLLVALLRPSRLRWRCTESTSDVALVTADLADRVALHRGLEACDAVVHATSVFSFDPAPVDEMADVNLSRMPAVISQRLSSPAMVPADTRRPATT